MADISVIKMPDNSSYNLKDAAARQSIAALPTDVRVNGTSVVSSNVANIPIASQNNPGVIKVTNGTSGLQIDSGSLIISPSSSTQIKGGTINTKPIVPYHQHEAVFFGLAKAANANMASIQGTTVGVYPNAQKQAIQNMLGITDLLSTEESSTAIAAHTINSLFMMDGKLHRATSAISIGDAVEAGTNCEIIKADEVFVKNTDYAVAGGNAGIVKIPYGGGKGIDINSDHELRTRAASSTDIRNGTNSYAPLTPHLLHESIYYGLSKLVGVDLKNETVTVGTYPETSKAAIQAMLGVPSTATATTSAAGLMSAADKTKLDGFSSASSYMTQCIIPFGYMDSSSTSEAFVATVPNLTSLTDGVAVYITNNIVSATGPFTLNVNNLGAKEVCWSDQASMRVSAVFKTNQTYLFIYNSTRITGGCWDLYKGYDSDNDYRAQIIMSRNFKPIAANYIVGPKIIFSQSNNKVLAPNTSNTTATTKTLTTDDFNPFLPIYWYPYTMAIQANAQPVITGMFTVYNTDTNGIDLSYSFNIGNSLIAKSAVYIKCSPQTNGMVKFAGDNCIVQSLPSTEDGYVYIYLGIAVSATNIDLEYIHPIFEYKNGAIRAWTNAYIPNTSIKANLSLIADEETTTATKAHTINSLFIMNEQLYRATSAIGIGDAVAAGTNCEIVNISEVIAKNTDVPVEYGTAVGSIKSKDYIYNNTTYSNTVTGVGSIAFGKNNNISGMNAIAFGDSNTITTNGGLAFGEQITVSNADAVAFGYGTTANCTNMVAMGKYNVLANTTIPNWTTNTYYETGAIAKTVISGSTVALMCIKAHTSSGNSLLEDLDENNQSQWKIAPSNGDTAFCIGCGTSSTTRKNALKVNFGGTMYLGGNVFVNCDSNSANGTKLPYDIQVNGISVLGNGIANIPMASSSNLGVVRVNSNDLGIAVNGYGEIYLNSASENLCKQGTNQYRALTPSVQDKAIYYGLSKLAGINLANETVTVGTYPESSKQAIQKLFGFADIFGPYEDDITADQAYAIGETFVMDGKRYKATAAIAHGGVITPGTNCELWPLDNVYIESTSVQGCKNGTNAKYPVTPNVEHAAAFYGLAKAAGDTTQSQSDNAVGIYTSNAKAAIQSMLGIEPGVTLIENVSGSTPSITGQPNVRYKCGEVSTLSITPPANGSCEVIFTSGSTATVLTVPNTVKFPPWFDVTTLEIDTIYDIIITDGVYGSVMSWVN